MKQRRYAIDLTISGEFDGDPSNIATWMQAALGRSGVEVGTTVYGECEAENLAKVSPELHNDLVDALENTTAALRNALASPELQSAMLAADLYGRSKTLAAAEAVLIRAQAQSTPHTALPRFEIEPQRDDLDGAGSDETSFVPCSEDVAQIFAVFERVGPAEDDFEWIGDFSSRPKAEAWIAAQPDVVASANR